MRRVALLSLVLVACGIDAVGTMVGGAPTTSPKVDGPPHLDASTTTDSSTADGFGDGAGGDATSDTSADANDGANDGALPKGPLCPPAAVGLVACFAFEGAATDGTALTARAAPRGEHWLRRRSRRAARDLHLLAEDRHATASRLDELDGDDHRDVDQTRSGAGPGRALRACDDVTVGRWTARRPPASPATLARDGTSGTS